MIAKPSHLRSLTWVVLALLICPISSFLGQVRNPNSIREIELTKITETSPSKHAFISNRKKILFKSGIIRERNIRGFNTIPKLRNAFIRFSLMTMLTVLVSTIFSSRQANAEAIPEEPTQTTNDECTSPVTSQLLITGGGVSKGKVISSESSKVSNKKEIAIFSGAIAGTTVGLGLRCEFKRNESDVEEKEDIYKEIIEPPTVVDATEKDDNSTTDVKDANASIEASEEAKITTNSEDTMIGSYVDTNAYLNSLVDSKFFEADQAEKQETKNKRVAAAKAEEEKAAEQVETKKIKLSGDMDDIVIDTSKKIIPLVQPLSIEDDKMLSEKYAKLPLNERAFQIILDLGMISVTPDPEDPNYDSTLDHELAPENVFV